MFCKILCLVFLAGAISARGHDHAYSYTKIIRHDGPHVPVYVHGHKEPFDYYAYPKYELEYMIDDERTGNRQWRQGFLDGDVVKGRYSLQQPDGSVRTVNYRSDGNSGFHADVNYGTHHIVPGEHS